MPNCWPKTRSIRRCCGVALSLVGAAGTASAARAETAAGTAIVNVAQLSYAAAGQDVVVASNESRVTVAERLDVALTAGAATTLADGTIAVAATLVNQGNGQEAFAITAAASAGAGQVLRIAYDGDGDGRYDPARDPELLAGRTPVLAPGQQLTLFTVVAAGTTGTVTLTAAAVTGSGAPGTTFAGTGDGGGDAIVGPTGAQASVAIPLTAPLAAAAPTLTKSAIVLAPDGSARAVRGATITYTLIARFPAATAAARLADPIPTRTTYAPASLTLDDAPLSDAADADAGDASPARISVTLGDQSAGAARTIRFKVVIQ